MVEFVLNILHDNRRIERLEAVVAEMYKHGIPYKIWDAVEGKNPVESISRGLKAIVQDAKDNGLKEVWIGEDDLQIMENGFEYFVKSKPTDFDVYIGGSYFSDNRNTYEAPLVKVQGWTGNQLIVISEKYYDTFLDTPEDKHIDTEQHGKGDFYVCFPYIALQRPAWSHNARGMVNYNESLPKHFIYSK